MSEPQTPGTWKIKPVHIDSPAMGSWVDRIEIVNADGCIVVGEVRRFADAHLIAAAPELQLALAQIVSAFKTTDVNSLTEAQAFALGFGQGTLARLRGDK